MPENHLAGGYRIGVRANDPTTKDQEFVLFGQGRHILPEVSVEMDDGLEVTLLHRPHLPCTPRPYSPNTTESKSKNWKEIVFKLGPSRSSTFTKAFLAVFAINTVVDLLFCTLDLPTSSTRETTLIWRLLSDLTRSLPWATFSLSPSRMAKLPVPLRNQTVPLFVYPLETGKVGRPFSSLSQTVLEVWWKIISLTINPF